MTCKRAGRVDERFERRSEPHLFPAARIIAIRRVLYVCVRFEIIFSSHVFVFISVFRIVRVCTVELHSIDYRELTRAQRSSTFPGQNQSCRTEKRNCYFSVQRTAQEHAGNLQISSREQPNVRVSSTGGHRASARSLQQWRRYATRPARRNARCAEL